MLLEIAFGGQPLEIGLGDNTQIASLSAKAAAASATAAGNSAAEAASAVALVQLYQQMLGIVTEATRSDAEAAMHADGTWIWILADEDNGGHQTLNEVVEGTIELRGIQSEVGFSYTTVAAMLGDVRPYPLLTVGSLVKVIDGGFAYEVAADDASDPWLLENSADAPVKLKFLSAEGRFPLRAFGCALDGVTDDTAAATKCGLQAIDEGGVIVGKGILGVNDTGAAGASITGACANACLNFGADDSFDPDGRFVIRGEGGELKLYGLTANDNAALLVVKHLAHAEIGDGVTFDGNQDNSDAAANGFILAGCEYNKLADGLTVRNCNPPRVCGSSFRRGGELHCANFRAINVFNASGCFWGKPFGLRSIFHKGTVWVNGEEGFHSGALTVDNDAVGGNSDQSCTAVVEDDGETVTLTCEGHGYEAGDWIYVLDVPRGTQAPVQGEFQVETAPDANTLTYKTRKPAATGAVDGTLTLRAAWGPYEQINLGNIRAANVNDDLVLFSLKMEDGFNNATIQKVFAQNLNEEDANPGFLGCFRAATGNMDMPVTSLYCGEVEAIDTRSAFQVQMRFADWGTVYIPSIRATRVTYGMDISEHQSVTQDADSNPISPCAVGTIDSVHIGTIEMKGYFTETNPPANIRTLAVFVSNTRANTQVNTLPIVNRLVVDEINMEDGASGVWATEGVRHIDVTLGRVTGGFSTADANPLSRYSTGNPDQRRYKDAASGTFVAHGSETIRIAVGHFEAGGRGLSAGKVGHAFTLYATESIEIAGRNGHIGIVDGGTGNDQITGAFLRLLVPYDASTHTTRARVTLRNLIIRNMSSGIVHSDITSMGSGDGFDLYMENVEFQSVAEILSTTAIGRFRSIRTKNCRGLLEGSAADSGGGLSNGASSTPVTITIAGMNSSDVLAEVRYSASVGNATMKWERVAGNSISCWFENDSGSGTTIGAGTWYARADMMRG